MLLVLIRDDYIMHNHVSDEMPQPHHRELVKTGRIPVQVQNNERALFNIWTGLGGVRCDACGTLWGKPAPPPHHEDLCNFCYRKAEEKMSRNNIGMDDAILMMLAQRLNKARLEVEKGKNIVKCAAIDGQWQCRHNVDINTGQHFCNKHKEQIPTYRVHDCYFSDVGTAIELTFTLQRWASLMDYLWRGLKMRKIIKPLEQERRNAENQIHHIDSICGGRL